MNRKQILDDAANAVLRDRAKQYGGPERSFGDIAALWSIVLRPVLKDGSSISPSQVALCMIQLKAARLIDNIGHKDSVVDIAGYAACLGEMASDGGEEV